jgi:hypothetical protein
MLVRYFRHDPSPLFHRDTNGKLLGRHLWHNNLYPTVLGLSFKESLVRHAFFERKKGKHERHLPCFFRNL